MLKLVHRRAFQCAYSYRRCLWEAFKQVLYEGDISVGYMQTVSSSRCFKHSAAINWNDLPFDIRACDSVNVFKRNLKTHLFNIAYAT